MNAKHTPGPWIVGCDKTSVLSITPVDMDKQRPCPKVVDCASGYDAMSFEEAKSNARLIAAAPDLLAALEEADTLCSALQGTIPRDDTSTQNRLAAQRKVIRAAIAKARGE